MDLFSYHIHSPYYLLLLLGFPFLFKKSKKREGALNLRVPSIALFASLKPTWRQKFSWAPSFLKIVGLIALIIALSRPQSGQKITEVLSEGVDIMLTIDTSGSMKALDFELDGKEVNRLDVVKKVVDDFISRRSYDRIGMVIFGDYAYTQCPLTHDKNSLKMFLQWIRIGIAGESTAIGDGLATAVKRLKDTPGKTKLIILLTDGRNNRGSITPEMAAQIALQFGIKVYTIGVGSFGDVPYPLLGYRQSMKLDLDEPTLQEIAKITGGQYFRAGDTFGLEKIYQTIDELEKTEIKIKEYHHYQEFYLWFLATGIILLVLEIILRQTLFLRVP